MIMTTILIIKMKIKIKILNFMLIDVDYYLIEQQKVFMIKMINIINLKKCSMNWQPIQELIMLKCHVLSSRVLMW